MALHHIACEQDPVSTTLLKHLKNKTKPKSKELILNNPQTEKERLFVFLNKSNL